MDKIRWIARPQLRSPKLIVAFEGWNDAGEAATAAAEYVRKSLGGEIFADIDPEGFYDFTESRPFVEITQEGRQISWPKNNFYAIELPDHDHDLIVLLGNEPQLFWRTYTEQIMAIVEEYDVELVISLGALVADVVHTRPTTIYSTSPFPKLIKELDLEPSNYEGPTGIVGVLLDALTTAEVGSLSLWGTVPSYAPHVVNPKASLAMVQRIEQILSISLETTEMEANTVNYEARLNELIAQDDETQQYITELEESYDSSMKPESGAALIEELEQFLRDRER